MLLKAERAKSAICIRELQKAWLFWNLNALIVNSSNQVFPKQELPFPLKVFLIPTHQTYYSHHNSIITKQFKCFLPLMHKEQGPTYLYHNTQFSVGLFMGVVVILGSSSKLKSGLRLTMESLPVDHWNSLLSNFSAWNFIKFLLDNYTSWFCN